MAHVRFEDVGIRLPRRRSGPEGVDLEVEPGQSVAILGTTGAGKSTLLSLIPRFYDVTRGRVLVDGVDVREFELDHLRRNIGLVFQESLLFRIRSRRTSPSGTRKPAARPSKRAAKTAGAHDFISELAERLRHGARGRRRQPVGRPATAHRHRARLLLEPPILLLDDPTTAIDPETEQEVLAAMDRAMAGRTTLVVANRLSTLRRADLIVVLHEGRIVERARTRS